MIKYIVQMRRGSAEQWANSTIIPLAGELVVEIDEEKHLHKLKIGDGVHKYSELAYLMAGDEIVTQLLSKALPRIITVTLDVDKWEKVIDEKDDMFGYYAQTATINNITKYSRLDLQPDVTMLAEFKNLNIAFVTENNGSTITVYSVGDMPLKTYTMQATVTETDVAADCDKIVGIPVGTPAPASVKEQIDYTVSIEDDATSADGVKKYIFKQLGEEIGSIDITTDLTEQLGATEVQLTIDGDKVISASLVDGGVSKSKLSQEVQDLIDNIPYELSDLSDDEEHRLITDVEKAKYDDAYEHSTSSHAPNNAQENVIEEIKVNDTVIAVNDKSVNINIPTKISDLTNDKGYITSVSEYSIEKDENSGDYAAIYHLTKDNVNIGAAINIPKDMVVQDGVVVTNPSGQEPGTYIKLTLQNVSDPLYINVGSLIEYVTSGSGTDDMVVINVSDDYKVTATITDGSITFAKFHSDVKDVLDKSHEHGNIEELNKIASGDVDKWNSKLDADDVPDWAKADTKPTYTYEDIIEKPILAQVATSGSYNDLIDKPEITSVDLSNYSGSSINLKSSGQVQSTISMPESGGINLISGNDNMNITVPASNVVELNSSEGGGFIQINPEERKISVSHCLTIEDQDSGGIIELSDEGFQVNTNGMVVYSSLSTFGKVGMIMNLSTLINQMDTLIENHRLIHCVITNYGDGEVPIDHPVFLIEPAKINYTGSYKYLYNTYTSSYMNESKLGMRMWAISIYLQSINSGYVSHISYTDHEYSLGDTSTIEYKSAKLNLTDDNCVFYII